MPVRLTNRGAYLLHYDKQHEKWESVKGIDVSWLKQPVSVEPGVTVADILDAVKASDAVSRFLAEYTGCDTEDIHTRDRSAVAPIVMHTGIEVIDGRTQLTGEMAANVLSIWCEVSLFTVDETFIEKRWELFASHHLYPDSGVGLVHAAQDDFGAVCALEIKLDTVARFRIHRGIGVEPDEERYDTGCTLLDFLDAIYSLFGRPKYDDRDAKTVEMHDDMIRKTREMIANGDDEDAADWWKKGDDHEE